MSNLYRDIEPGKNPPEEINVVIEIALNSSSKFEYNEDAGYMTLNRVLHSPFHYVFEYGFIPQTLSGDGDALDVVLLASRPTFAGCVVRARVVGVLLTEDEEGVDNKLIAVPIEKVDPTYKHVQDIGDVDPHRKKEIEHFFQDYKKLEEGKYEHVKVKDWKDKVFAQKLVTDAMTKYQEERA